MHRGQRAELGLRRVFCCCVVNCHALGGFTPHPPMSSHCGGWASGLSLDGGWTQTDFSLRVLFQVRTLLTELCAVIHLEVATSCPRASPRRQLSPPAQQDTRCCFTSRVSRL